METETQILQSSSAQDLVTQISKAVLKGWGQQGNVFTVQGVETVGGGDGTPLRYIPCQYFAVEMIRGEDARRFWLQELDVVVDAQPLTRRAQRRRLRELKQVTTVPRPSDWR